MRYYPVFLDLAGQPCIVLGEGKFAVEKAAALREAGANVRVIPSRDYSPGALAGARLVVDASEDPEVNRQSWDEAEADQNSKIRGNRSRVSVVSARRAWTFCWIWDAAVGDVGSNACIQIRSIAAM